MSSNIRLIISIAMAFHSSLYPRNEGISGFLRGVFPNALKVRIC